MRTKGRLLREAEEKRKLEVLEFVDVLREAGLVLPLAVVSRLAAIVERVQENFEFVQPVRDFGFGLS